MKKEFVVTWRDRKGQYRTTLMMCGSTSEAYWKIMNRRNMLSIVSVRELETKTNETIH